MGVTDLVAAFNSVGPPRYTAQRATLGYLNAHDVQWQVITFYGTGADGVAFTAVEKLRPGADVIVGSRAAAQKLLDKREPLS